MIRNSKKIVLGKEPRKEGEKVVVKIMAVEPCEPYHVQSCHKIYRHKLIVQRRKKGKEANREVEQKFGKQSFRVLSEMRFLTPKPTKSRRNS